ncbi:SAICAR synthase-like protein [Dentipellis sp. KUC8613]|nr:SAICAR synthase-like protein [Dentipellis sp. KUC8613]
MAPAPERQSLASSSASFQTTQIPPFHRPSESASREYSRDSAINPIHRISQSAPGGSNLSAQEVHIIKVTDNKVEMQAGTPPQSFMHKLGDPVMRVVGGHDRIQNLSEGGLSSVGPPPPSPPASVEQLTPAEPVFISSPIKYSKSEPPAVTFDSSVKDHRAPPVSFSSSHGPIFSAGPSSIARSSTDTKLTTRSSGTRSHSQPFPTDDTDFSTLDDGSSISQSLPSRGNHLHQSADGYLQPPTHSRPSRRNTTGSAGGHPPKPRPPVRGQSALGLPFDDSDVAGELASDIEQQAEQIRRERLSKRAKAQQEAEAALTRPPAQEDNSPLVGNLIGENHVNYVLMYNMLTGIRIAVSRCQAKIRRELTDEDFTARHKYSFDIIGNELTPSAKYDFKFKDYAPFVFRELREDSFHLDPADYLLSLTAKYILSELGSPGKSGSFFYFSRDYRFIIKTIHHSEHKYLRSILKDYYRHVKENPHTLLSRFYGLHRVKLPHGRKIHFVIMNNLFPAHKDIHETYDLKGSTVGRLYPEEKAQQNPRAVLKDLNWINRNKSLELGPEKRALLTEQLRRDSEFLKKLWVMDYSLLVGIHNMQRGNRDNVRRNTLKVFSPSVPPIRRKPAKMRGSSPEAMAMRRAMRESDPKRLGLDTLQLPEEDTGDRQHFIFYQDEGGLQATDEQNESMDTIYYLGVIDILTPYSTFKKLEHFWKGLSADRHKISPVPPTEYADRFFSFMKSIMRGGGGGARFKSE